MNTFRDQNGLYRLDAIAAVTPHEVRDFAHPTLKNQPNTPPPVLKVVAVVHLAGGATLVTDTEYEAVVALFAEASGQVIAPAQPVEGA